MTPVSSLHGSIVAAPLLMGLERKKYYLDRREAGREMAQDLKGYAGRACVIILALPPGGVPVACEIASALGAPLDVMLTQTLSVRGADDVDIGALAGGAIGMLHEPVLRQVGIQESALEQLFAAEAVNLHQREAIYRGNSPYPSLKGRIVILVDDGSATSTMLRIAIEAVRQQEPLRVVVVVPIASQETCEDMRRDADECHCGITPVVFAGIDQWYEQSLSLSDEDASVLLRDNVFFSPAWPTQCMDAKRDHGRQLPKCVNAKVVMGLLGIVFSQCVLAGCPPRKPTPIVHNCGAWCGADQGSLEK